MVCLLGSIAGAKQPARLDVLTRGNPGDWTVFELERRTKQGLVKERAIALVAETSVPLVRRVVWFRGRADHEASWTGVFLHQLLLDLRGEKATRIAAATCKLETSFACTKWTYRAEPRFSSDGREVTVSATTAARIRDSSLLELEVRRGAELQSRMKAIGYGNGARSAWGVGPSKAKLEVPAELAGLSGMAVERDFASDFLSLGR